MSNLSVFKKNVLRVCLLAVAVFVSTALALAGDLAFVGKCDKDPLSYEPGEEMVFSITLTEDGQPVSGKNLVWTRRGDDGKSESGEAVSSADEPLVIKTSLSTPGFVHILVRVKDDNGNPIHSDPNEFNGGAGVLLDQIQGFPEPDDFDAFWARQKERLAEVPVKAELKQVDSPNDKVNVWDVRIDCVGTPVSGYLCVPKDAAPGSLPIKVFYHGYGVGSAGKYADPNFIALDVNAHSIENGREAAYYENLRKTGYGGYGLSPQENANPETCFWNGMMLRLMRSLQYVKTLPEWNGKDLIVTGGSQGGLQCLSAAALDHDVTECIAVVPWFCNLAGAKEQGRVGSYFFPEWTPGLGYYDSTNQAKRIQCKTTILAGLGDYVCPPSGQMVLYNNMTCPVRLEFMQGRTHGFSAMKDAGVFVLEK
ncbi:MAG: acetylxylan esterase [Planctomycetia bacterium]|nr:acetylxylan esterase [Planctomycetia bacterium]